MPGLRELHMDRTRAAIIDAALGLFAEKGFAQTTIEDIVERAGVGRRTFFRYFPAKDAVLFHDVEAHIEAAVDDLRARPDDKPPYQALLATMREAADRFASDADHRALMARVAADNESLFTHHRAVIMRRMEDALAAEMARRQGLELRRPGHPGGRRRRRRRLRQRHPLLAHRRRHRGPMVDEALDAAQEALGAAD